MPACFDGLNYFNSEKLDFKVTSFGKIHKP